MRIGDILGTFITISCWPAIASTLNVIGSDELPPIATGETQLECFMTPYACVQYRKTCFLYRVGPVIYFVGTSLRAQQNWFAI